MERCRGQQGRPGTGGAASATQCCPGGTVPLSPPIPKGLPPSCRAGCPQRTPLPSLQMPSCVWSWLSHAVPTGMGLWHAQDGDRQCCSSTLAAGDKERSPQDRPATPPPAMPDQLPLASAGSVSARPLLDSWVQAGPARACARHPDGTGTAKTCQQHPRSTAVFVPLSVIKPVSDEGPSQVPAWSGRAGGEKGRGTYLEGHLWVQREAGAVSPWHHPSHSPWPAPAPALPMSTHTGSSCWGPQPPQAPVPCSSPPGGPGSPPAPPHPHCGGSQGQAAFAPHGRSTGSPSHHGGVQAAAGGCSGCRPPARPQLLRLQPHTVQAQKPHPPGAGGRGASLPALAACKNNPGTPRAGAAEKHGPVRGGSELPSQQPPAARPKARALPALRSPAAVPALGAKGRGRVPQGR